MPKQFTTTPFEERKSQNLGPLDFIKENAWALLPFVGLAVGVVAGKLTKNSMMPFDGTPPFILRLQELGMRKGAKTMAGVDTKKLEALDYMPYARFMSDTPAGQEQAAKTMLNGLKGLEMGAIPSAYFFWRKREAARVDLVDNHAQLEGLKKLDGLKPNNDELQLEKRSLEQQLGHEREKAGLSPLAVTPNTHISSAEAQGQLAAPSEERLK